MIKMMIIIMMMSMMSDVPIYFKTLRTSDAGVLTPPLRSGVFLVPMRCNPVYDGKMRGKRRKDVSEKKRGRKEERKERGEKRRKRERKEGKKEERKG